MTATEFLAVVLGVWAVCGLVIAVVMGRRGHSPFSWGVIGLVFGPLTFVLAVQAIVEERTAQPRPVHRGGGGAGGVDVLVGIDSSPEASAALEKVVALLDGRIGRLTLATVADYESVSTGAGRERRDELDALLERHALPFVTHDPDTVILPGRPAEALAGYAREHGYDLVVIGSRGAGRSKAVLGSVASALARGIGIPVLTVGPDDAVHQTPAAARAPV